MNKLKSYYKCYGVRETIKKVFRYLRYKKSFKNPKRYTKLTKYEKKHVILKKNDIYVIGYSFKVQNYISFINAINYLGFNVVFVSKDNKNVSIDFLNIKSNIKLSEFDNNKEYVIDLTEQSTEVLESIDSIYYFIDNYLDKKLPKRNTIDLSIIVLNYNNDKIIFDCLDSLKKHNSRYNYNIVVIDNNSTDGSYEKLKKYKGITLYKNPKNGCSSGRNIGIKNIKTKYIMFLDSDQLVLSDYWLDNYINIIDANKVIGWAAGWFNKSNLSGKTVDFYEYRYMPPVGLIRNDIGYLGTGGMLLTTKLLNKTNLFDENFDPTCYEDTDISIQLKDIGAELIYCPSLAIFHNEHQTTESGSINHLMLMNKNGEYFKNKWKEKKYLFLYK